MGRAERHVGEERPVRRDRLLGPHPVDRVVDQVLRQVVAVLRQPVGLDRGGPGVELRVPVVHLRAHEAVERAEPLAGRPPRERPGLADLGRRGLVPLAEGGGAVAVAAQDLRDRGRARGPVAVVAGLRRRHLRRHAHADRVVVAAGQQRLPGRRAQGRDVEAAEAQPLVGQPLGGRHLAGAAVRRGRAEAHVVDEDEQHVGCSVGRRDRPDRPGAGVDVEREAGSVGHEAHCVFPSPPRAIDAPASPCRLRDLCRSEPC